METSLHLSIDSIASSSSSSISPSASIFAELIDGLSRILRDITTLNLVSSSPRGSSHIDSNHKKDVEKQQQQQQNHQQDKVLNISHQVVALLGTLSTASRQQAMADQKSRAKELELRDMIIKLSTLVRQQKGIIETLNNEAQAKAAEEEKQRKAAEQTPPPPPPPSPPPPPQTIIQEPIPCAECNKSKSRLLDAKKKLAALVAEGDALREEVLRFNRIVARSQGVINAQQTLITDMQNIRRTRHGDGSHRRSGGFTHRNHHHHRNGGGGGGGSSSRYQDDDDEGGVEEGEEGNKDAGDMEEEAGEVYMERDGDSDKFSYERKSYSLHRHATPSYGDLPDADGSAHVSERTHSQQMNNHRDTSASSHSHYDSVYANTSKGDVFDTLPLPTTLPPLSPGKLKPEWGFSVHESEHVDYEESRGDDPRRYRDYDDIDEGEKANGRWEDDDQDRKRNDRDGGGGNNADGEFGSVQTQYRKEDEDMVVPSVSVAGDMMKEVKESYNAQERHGNDQQNRSSNDKDSEKEEEEDEEEEWEDCDEVSHEDSLDKSPSQSVTHSLVYSSLSQSFLYHSINSSVAEYREREREGGGKHSTSAHSHVAHNKDDEELEADDSCSISEYILLSSSATTNNQPPSTSHVPSSVTSPETSSNAPSGTAGPTPTRNQTLNPGWAGTVENVEDSFSIIKNFYMKDT